MMLTYFPSLSYLMRAVALAIILSPLVNAQNCTAITPANPPVMAGGYQSRLVANGLRYPRDMVFDSQGNLLVVQQSSGGVALLQLADHGGFNVCAQSVKTLIADTTLNHGIDLSVDGRTLFVSYLDGVDAYPYDPVTARVGTKKTLIANMTNGGLHLSRTLVVSYSVPGLLLVQRGSDGNLDMPTMNVSSGRSQIRIFNVTELMAAASPVDYLSGEVLGWGLRNTVGMTEDPSTGGIWSVENSADDLVRQGKDIHQTNPGEELNYHGTLNNTRSPQREGNYGYPTCFAAWDPSVIPDNTNITVGTQFVIGDLSATNTDANCAQFIAPTLTLPSHTAPIDIKFTKNGSSAYVTFHGSWDRQPPDGYRISRIDFKNGQPVAPSNSTTAAIDVMTNPSNANCPSGCFRPAGLAWDAKGRLFMSSDATGEIFVITGA